MPSQVILITGAARRIGAVVAQHLHAKGFNLIIHYHTAVKEAQQLTQQLCAIRKDSCICLAADLTDPTQIAPLVTAAAQQWQRLDVLINNASAFFPTPIGNVSTDDWDTLLGSNVKAPFFLSQAAMPWLQKQQGCIINITDIHGQKALRNYPVYSIAKAGLNMLTQVLAKELGPSIRVNGIAPGLMIWPEAENALTPATQQALIAQTALQRQGDPLDIAQAAYFLINHSPYVTGTTLTVDGGRSL